MGSKYLDEQHSGKAARQSAELENHGDRDTAGDPNAMGPTMRSPYTAVSPMFVDSVNGVDQTLNESQNLDGADYPASARTPHNRGGRATAGGWASWLGRRSGDKSNRKED